MTDKNTPDGSPVSEGRFVTLNGTRQWIAIQGTDRRNPVILYLHGGPGASTGLVDYVSFREITDRFTVVSWDQRNCGKSRDRSLDSVPLTPELFISDALELTRFLCGYLHQEKLILFGHSWGSLLGANLVLGYPQYYSAFVAASLHADWSRNESDLRQRAIDRALSTGDNTMLAKARSLDPESCDDAHYKTRDGLVKWLRKGETPEKGRNLAAALLKCPYANWMDKVKYITGGMYPGKSVMAFLTGGGMKSMSLRTRTEYAVPFYLIQGDSDVITGFRPAVEYFEQVTAPDKALFVIEGGGHNSIMLRPGALAENFGGIARRLAGTGSVSPGPDKEGVSNESP